MIIKYLPLFLPILMYNDFKATNISTVYARCILHTISEIFSKESTIHFMYENVNDMEMVRYIENPVIVLYFAKKWQGEQLLSTRNFVVYMKQNTLMVTLYNIKNYTYYTKNKDEAKILIILKENENQYNVANIFEVAWKCRFVDIFILVNDNSPKLFYYEPLTTASQCGKFPKIDFVPESNIAKFIKGRKPIHDFHKCKLSLMIPGANAGVRYPGFQMIKTILNVVDNALNATTVLTNKTNIENLDIVIGTLSGLVHRSYDFFEVILSDTNVILLPMPKQLTMFEAVAKTFDTKMWIFISLTFVLTLICWFYIEKFIGQNDQSRGILNSFMTIFQLTLLLSLPNLPNRNILRFVLLLYVIYSMHIICLFQADLVNTLTIPRYEKRITTFQEFLDYRIPLLMHRYTVYLFFPTLNVTEKIKLLSKVIELPYYDDHQIIKDIEKYGDCSYMVQRMNLPRVTSLHILSDNVVIYPSQLFLATRKGDFHKYILIPIMRRLYESGIHDKIITDHWPKYHKVIEESPKIKLNLSHLNFAFLIWFGGMALCCLSFLVEKAVWYVTTKRNNRVIVLQ